MAILLVITVFLPLLGSLVLVPIAAARRPRRRGRSRWATALATLVLSLILLAGFHSERGGSAVRLSDARAVPTAWLARLGPTSDSPSVSTASASGCSC